MKVKVWIIQSCPTLHDSMDCSLPHCCTWDSPGKNIGVESTGVDKNTAIPFSKGFSQPRGWTQISCIAGRFFTVWAIREVVSQSVSHSVVSNSLRPQKSQHTRPPCPSPTPWVYSNSCPSSKWCHSAISSSVVPFTSRPQCLPASGSFPMSQLFAWGGQRTGFSASASALSMNTPDQSPLGWTGWISLQSKGLSRVFSNTTVQKHQFFGTQLSSQSKSHIHTWPLEKPQPWPWKESYDQPR